MFASNFTIKDYEEAYDHIEHAYEPLPVATVVNRISRTSINLYLIDIYLAKIELDLLDPLRIEVWSCKQEIGVIYTRVNATFVIKLNAILPGYKVVDELPVHSLEFFMQGKYIITLSDLDFVKMCYTIYNKSVLENRDVRHSMKRRIDSYNRCTADNRRLANIDAVGHIVEEVINLYKKQYIKLYKNDIKKTTSMVRIINIVYVVKSSKAHIVIESSGCNLGLLYDLSDGSSTNAYFIDAHSEVIRLMHKSIEITENDLKTEDLWNPSINIFPTTSRDDAAMVERWKSLTLIPMFSPTAHNDVTSLTRAVSATLGLPTQVPHIEIDSISKNVNDSDILSHHHTIARHRPELSDNDKMMIIGRAGLGVFSNSMTIRAHEGKFQKSYNNGDIWEDMQPGEVWVRPNNKSKRFWDTPYGKTVYHKQLVDNKLPIVNIKTKIINICKDNKLQLTPSELNVYCNQVVKNGYFKFSKKHLDSMKNKKE